MVDVRWIMDLVVVVVSDGGCHVVVVVRGSGCLGGGCLQPLAEIKPAIMKAPGCKVTKGSPNHHSHVSETTMHDATYSAV